jgi:hypothetical protein
LARHFGLKLLTILLANKHKNGGTPFRGNYAGIGMSEDEDNQIFWIKNLMLAWVIT